MTVTVLSKPSCVQCTATYRRLDAEGVEYKVDDIYTHMELIKNLGYMAAPVVLIYDEDGELSNHWSGFRPDYVEELALTLKAA